MHIACYIYYVFCGSICNTYIPITYCMVLEQDKSIAIALTARVALAIADGFSVTVGLRAAQAVPLQSQYLTSIPSAACN